MATKQKLFLILCFFAFCCSSLALPDNVKQAQASGNSLNPTPTPAPQTTKTATEAADERVSSKTVDSSFSNQTESNILKAQGDQRFYRQIKLDNGLNALLISDPLCTKAAAALNVRIGSWKDPEEIPGLAHFLEHMLFLGTSKFPEEDSYNDYLSTHGGSSNAFTGDEETNFFFDVEPSGFNGALERFAEFFISPLLTESATSREVHAVESEHSKNLQSDNWRLFQLLESFGDVKHPFHKFATGSVDTLGKLDQQKLHSALLDFYHTYYIAQNMNLVVLNFAKLDDLETQVRSLFANVPASTANSAVEPFNCEDKHEEVIQGDKLGSMIRMKSVKNQPSISIFWMLPPQAPFYASKSVDYIATLVGHEGSGSLLSALKKKGLVHSINAGSEMSTKSFELFRLTLEVPQTSIADDKLDAIMTEVFNYLSLIEKSGVDEWRWQEMARIASIRFNMKSKEDPQNYVSTLADNLMKFAPQDILASQFTYRNFDATAIHSLLSQMTPAKAIVLLSAQTFGPDITFPLTERWYGTQYNFMKMTEKQANEWSAARSGSSIDSLLKLPERNPFIPSSFEIKKESADASWTEPHMILEQVQGSRVRVWFKQDVVFKRPKANLQCKMWTNSFYGSAKQVIVSTLYTKVVRDALNEVLYPATLIGFQFDIVVDSDGFELLLSGYDSLLADFTKSVSSYLMVNPDADRFQLLKAELKKEYENFKYSAPYAIANYNFALLLENPHWQVDEYLAVIDSVTPNDVVEWNKQAFSDMAVECLVHGNVVRSEALEIVKGLTSSISFKSSSTSDRSQSSQVQRIARVRGSYEFRAQGPNPNDQNSAVYTYYQQGVGDLNDEVKSILLAQILEKPAFHQLRTVEQLGYIVWSGTDPRKGVYGLRVIVQSSVKQADYLQKRVESLIDTIPGLVSNLTDDQFKSHVAAQIATQSRKPRTLVEESTRYWNEIINQHYMFDRRAKSVDILKGITKDQIKSYALNIFKGENNVPNMLSIQINSQKQGNAPSLVELDRPLGPAEHCHNEIGRKHDPVPITTDNIAGFKKIVCRFPPDTVGDVSKYDSTH